MLFLRFSPLVSKNALTGISDFISPQCSRRCSQQLLYSRGVPQLRIYIVGSDWSSLAYCRLFVESRSCPQSDTAGAFSAGLQTRGLLGSKICAPHPKRPRNVLPATGPEPSCLFNNQNFTTLRLKSK